MKLRKWSREIAVSLSLVAVALAGCGGGGSSNTIVVAVSPAAATVIVKQQQAFASSVTGATNTNVTWTLTISSNNCSPGCGTLDSTTNATITYTAPATIPSSLIQAPGSTTTPPSLILTATSVQNKKKTGTATITLDSGIRVTVTPATATVASGATGFPPEHFKFTATADNDTATNPVTWIVTQATTLNAAAATCSPGCGSVDTNGVYTAPTTLPTNTAVTVLAFDKIDNTRFANATVTLVDPTKNKISFTGITPTITALGGLQQDVYMNVTNLRSTISVLYDGALIDPNSTQLKVINATVARLRLSAANLSTAGIHAVSVVDQQGNAQNEDIQIVPVRPALVATTPQSFLKNPLPNTINLDGGYFGSTGNPVVSAFFAGSLTALSPPTVPAARQLQINLQAGNLSTPGLFPVGVSNNAATPSTATVNFAVQPDITNNPPVPLPVLSLPGPGGAASRPSAIAVDSILEVAVVTEQATSSVQLASLTGGVPSLTVTGCASVPCAPITATMNQPTGVAIDDQLAVPNCPAPVCHEAAVVNSGNNTVTIIQIPTGTVLGTANLAGLVPAQSGTPAPTPFAIGIDPFTHLALVAFSSSNVGFIINIDPSNANPGCIFGKAPPFCPVASVSLNTGPKPQIAFEPRLHLAFVTPGGAGLLSVVDLKQKNTTVPIAAAPSGAVRTNDVVTINTGSTPTGINPAVGGTVLITGVTPSDFNGSFQVSSVIDAFTFTYSQTGPDETGGSPAGGPPATVSFGNPDLTFSISATDQGIAINPETRTAVIADPNASLGQITFISTLDEAITSLSLQVGSFETTAGAAPEIGATWVGVQPFTNVAVSFNPQRNEISFIDPTRPQRLALAMSTGQTAIGSYTPSGGGTAINVTGGLAVDPVTNLALVVNSGSNNLVGIPVGVTSSLKKVHIRQVQLLTNSNPPTPYEIPGAILPQAVLGSNSSLPPGVATPILGTVKILGAGFFAGSPGGIDVQVTLDGVALPAPPVGFKVMSDEEIDIPASSISSFLSVPRRFALEVQDTNLVFPNGQSNAADFTVVQTIDVSGGCSGTSTPQPSGVAIDEQRNDAVVTNTGCNDISILDLTPGAPVGSVVKKSVAVGKAPMGVAVIPRLGLAVVTNNGDGTASIVNLDTASVTAPVTVGTSPMGVAIDQDTAAAVIANNGSNTVSQIDLSVLAQTPPGTPKAISGAVDEQPIAVAIDPDRGTNNLGEAVVTALQTNGALPPSGVADVVDIGGGSPAKNSSASISTLSATPTGVVLDNAVSPALFYITSSDGNTINAFDPDSGSLRTAPVGINPTSLAYNVQTGTIITVNSASNTISVLDSQTFETRATFGIGGSPLFAVAIHPRTNMVVIADQANNRVVVYPL